MAKSSVIRKAKPLSRSLTDGVARGAADQVRKLQLHIYDVMNLCNVTAAAACSQQREEDDNTTRGSMLIAARELARIAEGLDAAATALEVTHG